MTVVADLTPQQRELLNRMIYEQLSRSTTGMTTVGVRNAVAAIEDGKERKSRYTKVGNRLGFDIPLSLIVDALIGMRDRGAVSREDGAVETLLRAKRLNK